MKTELNIVVQPILTLPTGAELLLVVIQRRFYFLHCEIYLGVQEYKAHHGDKT